jgi:uncharacterized membrane protein YhiD involved in acid resistance
MIQFDKDKQIHAAVGVAIGILTMKFAMPIAFASLVVIALGKEVYDHFYPDKHTADVTDFLTTVGAGAIAMYVTSMF